MVLPVGQGVLYLTHRQGRPNVNIFKLVILTAVHEVVRIVVRNAFRK